MDEARGVIDVAVVQGEDLAGAHGCLADREHGTLEDQPVAVGAARAGAPTKPLVLLVADHLEADLSIRRVRLIAPRQVNALLLISSRSSAWLKNWRADCWT